MKPGLVFGILVCATSCAGQHINNRPADLPGSAGESEQMLQDNAHDKAPPSKPERGANDPAPAPAAEPESAEDP